MSSEESALSAPIRTGLVDPSWTDILDRLGADLADLAGFLRAERLAGRAFVPAEDRVLAALSSPLAAVRVLIVGQDPYASSGHAVGLAFAVARGVRPLPPSLVNIHAEYSADLGLPAPAHGDLSAWVSQGVLLLNRCLTVGLGAPGSHRGRGWEKVTDAIVAALVARGTPLVALLWGRDAQRLTPMLEQAGVTVLAAPHPSPLSAHRGFLGSRPFSRANAALEARGASPIDWRLPD